MQTVPDGFCRQGNVVDFNGDYIGFVNGDGTVIDVLGTVLGRIDAKGLMFNEKGEYKGWSCTNRSWNWV